MVGILRRFHIYPSDATWSDFRSEAPLSHLRSFHNTHSFLISAHSKPDIQDEKIGSMSCPATVSSDLTAHKTKKRRRAHTPLGYTHQSVPCMQLRSGKSEPSLGSNPHNFASKSVDISRSPEVLSTCGYSTTSAPYTPIPQLKHSSVHPAHVWPSQSAPINVRSFTSDPTINWEHVKVEPILTSFGPSTPLSKTDVGIVLKHVEEDRKRTFSGTSHGGDLSDTTDSTTSMPNIAPVCRSDILMQELTTATCIDLHRDARTRSANKRNDQDSRDKSTLRSKRRSATPVAVSENNLSCLPKRPKRRGSVELLREPSIHPSPDLENNPLFVREKRSVVTVSEPSPLRVPILSSDKVESGSSCLHTSSKYHLPDFSLFSPNKSHRKRFHEHLCAEIDDDLHSEINSSNNYIEVPSWRVLPFSAILQSVKESELEEENLSRVPHRKAASVADQASESVLRRLRGGVIRSPGVLEPFDSNSSRLSDTTSLPSSLSLRGTSLPISPNFSGSQADTEDTSDAAYRARHARLELEEIRRERRCRQRTFELELKHRLEQKERASWLKRQPGRLDPLTRYNPKDRIPIHLNLEFGQIRHLHVCKSIPVIAFGACLPTESVLKSLGIGKRTN